MFAAFITTILFSISAVCGNRAAKLLGGTEANFWRLVIIPFSYHLEGECPSRRSLAGGALAVCGAAVLAWIAYRSQ